jgi:polygalacturonase
MTQDVTSHGAVGDATTPDTEAVQRAIDAAAHRGGGAVLFPPGTYRCGTLHLRSRVTLRLELGAVLLASKDHRDFDLFESLSYPPWADQETHSFTFALLAGQDLDGVAIVGEGTIADDRGHRIGPKPIALKRCRNVVVRGVTIVGAPNYAVSLLGCDHVIVDGVTIRNGYADGIDPDCCRFVRIANCDIDCWDDGICIKTSLSLGEPWPTEHVTVANCTLRSSCNNFKIGTETSGAVRNVSVSNCTMVGRPGDPPSDENSGIAIESADGAVVAGIVVSNVVMQDVSTPVFVRLGNRGRGLDPPMPGSITAVRMSNLVATGARFTSSITGIPGHSVRSISIDGFTVDTEEGHGPVGLDVPEQADHYPRATMFGPLPARALYVRHAEDVTIRDLEVRGGDGDARPALVCDDVQGVRLAGLRADEPAYLGRSVTTAPDI